MNDWFRSWHKAPDHKKWRTVAKRAKVPTSVVVALVWTLMDRASQAEDRGSVAGYDAESIADYLDCEPEDDDRVVRELHDKQTLVGNRFEGWERYQPKRERDDATATERKQAERARKRGGNGSGGGGTENVTPNHADVTPCHTTSRTDKRREDTDTPSPSGDGRPTAADRQPELAFRSEPEVGKPELRVVDGEIIAPKPQSAETREPPVDPDAAYYRRGREILGGGQGALLTSLKRHFGGNIADARAVIEHAATRDGSLAYVAGVIAKPSRAGPSPRATPHNPRLAASRQLGEYLDAQSR